MLYTCDYISAFTPHIKNPFCGLQLEKRQVLIGSWLKALQHSKMLMAAWLAFGSNDIRDLLGFFYNFIEKY